jgi:hypothetical protein
MSTRTVTRTSPATLAELTEWKDDTSKHGEALKALRSCKTPEEFAAAFPVARAILRDSDAAESAVVEAKAIAKVGREVADAHTTYRLSLTAQYLRWFPKVGNRDLARALWEASDADIVRREKMVARDRKALAIIAAAKAGRADAPEGASISVPSPSAALNMVKHATATEAKAMADRAKKGETIVAPVEKDTAPVKMGRLVSVAASLVDSLDNVDAETVTPEAIAAILGSLAKAARKVEALRK